MIGVACVSWFVASCVFEVRNGRKATGFNERDPASVEMLRRREERSTLIKVGAAAVVVVAAAAVLLPCVE